MSVYILDISCEMISIYKPCCELSIMLVLSNSEYSGVAHCYSNVVTVVGRFIQDAMLHIPFGKETDVTDNSDVS